MKLNVCKEITSMDLNKKIIASFQPNMSFGRYNLKAIQANEINFANSSAQQYFKNPYRHLARFNLLQFWPSVQFLLYLLCY